MGRILASSVEVNLTAHCNLSCYGCDHASPARAEGYLSVEDLKADLEALADVYHVFEFFLTGGEPLLHPRLNEVLDTIRASGVAERIVVVSNGVLLHRAPDGFWDRIDKLWVSLYPGVKRKLSNDAIRRLAEDHGVLLNLKVTDDFTNRLMRRENQDPALVDAIFSTCTLRASCHTIHEGRYFKCSPSPFVPEWSRLAGAPPVDFSGDGVPLRGNPDLERQLRDYLQSDEPLAACRFCLGTVGKTVQSRQMNRREVGEWLNEPAPDAKDLVDWPALEVARTRLAGRDLSGLKRGMLGMKLRWAWLGWLRRVSGVDLSGAAPLALRARLRGWLGSRPEPLGRAERSASSPPSEAGRADGS